ncbi:receptor-transporting protein 3 [Phyllostomus discolor]|uniref:Receptor-transporting protein 3 n=1 Tax=Phyllostomus discolor TaxID=89673 RepID=A0A6J2M2Z9_9CHIR|nr:receptor-transporting protein 3 [Phyllostomus discolor]
MPAVTGRDVKVWQKVFRELIQEVKPRHHWTLTLDGGLTPSGLQPGWTQYQQRAFARFRCSLCSRSWASAHVCVLFHMHWSKMESRGQVRMRIFAQRCKKCSQPPFEVPEFTEENASRILNNLVLRILRSCYREGHTTAEEIPSIMDTVLEGPHDANNCEACLQGSCAQGRLGPAKRPPMSPPLPKISSSNGGIPAYQPSPARSSTRGDARVKEGEVFPSPWFSQPPANATYRSDSVIHVPSIENSHSPEVQNRTPCSSDSGRDISSICCCKPKICCCSVISIVILISITIVIVVLWQFS